MKSRTACQHNNNISRKGLPVWIHRACTSSSQGWHSDGLEPSNTLTFSNCLSILAFLFSCACTSTPICMVYCRALANCVVVLSRAFVIAVVFELPCVTAFIIRVITAEISDTGAECALDTLEGAIGAGGNGIGK